VQVLTGGNVLDPGFWLALVREPGQRLW